MAPKKVMSPQITLFPTMCPSTVWCRRGDWTIVPLSSSAPESLRPPTAASVHSRGHMGDMWPSRAHNLQLKEGFMPHGGRAVHA